ncbi:ABC transporter permease [Pseudonocardia phyllosphaerae]|uniref:ABC transporter permease n=1 Tax=Pseudonocardia phyllosphaerae TaxID=3390502 RepID=UPI00397D9859
MNWVFRNSDLVLDLVREHLVLSLLPVVIGLVLAVPLGWIANRRGWLRTLTLNAAGFLYTLPSLALFVFLPLILGTRILDAVNVVIAMTVYVLALLVRTVADGLSAVPPRIIDSATAMGYRPVWRFLTVELPVAIPVIVAGLRVAAVSSISLVTVGSVIGFGGLGKLFTEGFQREIPQETITGIVLVLLVALVVDGLLVLGGRLATPWERAGAHR